jgi:hypothetical protein
VAIQPHDYRGYRIVMRRHGSGWRATIYAPDSQQPILGPQSDDPASRDDILDRAKRLIDDLMDS